MEMARIERDQPDGIRQRRSGGETGHHKTENLSFDHGELRGSSRNSADDATQT
jgi:hypothetical protein